MKRIFGAMNRRYLVRAYLIGLAFFTLMMVLVWDSQPDTARAKIIGLLIVNLLLFPFAKFAWDELRDFIRGDSVIIQFAIFHFFFKYIVNGFLFATATFIAPFGIAYLWFRTRNRTHTEQPPHNA